MAAIDLYGKTFGRLKVLEKTTERSFGAVVWLCSCACGKKTKVPSSSLTKGNTSSCGCLRLERQRAAVLKHGMSGSKEYHAWYNAVDRCHNKDHPAYKDYGERGIRVCTRWRNSFDRFLKDMGRCPDGKELDRRDNEGDYRKSNCRWVTHEVNANNKRDTVKLTYKGKTLSLSQWSRERGILFGTIHARLSRGLKVKDVLARR